MLGLCLICCLLPIDEPLKFGVGKPWYDQEKTAAATFEGILDYQPATGRIGIPANYAPFRFIRKLADSEKVEQYVAHAPGLEPQLAENVGQRVAIEGKLIVQGEGEQKRELLYVGKLTPLGIAPVNVFTELKPLARTDKFQAQAVQMGASIGSAIIRSNKDAARAVGISQLPDGEREAHLVLCKYFGVKAIDWKSQMVVYIGPVNATRISPRKLEITRVEVHERGATVFWKADELQALNRAPSTDSILVPRVDGEITFKQVTGKKPADGKTEDNAPEKLIPRAPLK